MCKKGTYIVLLQSNTDEHIEIGKHGLLQLETGVYAYVGSAFGPGGVAARLKHHRSVSTRPHWHIDYLRARTQYLKAHYVISAHRYEHEWAKFLENTEGVKIPMRGFGSSDCVCKTHLFYFSGVEAAENCTSKLPDIKI
jgi:Uri superfamily endonuclease